jgi:hypothetical protein
MTNTITFQNDDLLSRITLYISWKVIQKVYILLLTYRTSDFKDLTLYTQSGEKFNVILLFVNVSCHTSGTVRQQNFTSLQGIKSYLFFSDKTVRPKVYVSWLFETTRLCRKFRIRVPNNAGSCLKKKETSCIPLWKLTNLQQPGMYLYNELCCNWEWTGDIHRMQMWLPEICFVKVLWY